MKSRDSLRFGALGYYFTNILNLPCVNQFASAWVSLLHVLVVCFRGSIRQLKGVPKTRSIPTL